jgi:anti-sigma regulatory factor (Ser/Thr protein kinase)
MCQDPSECETSVPAQRESVPWSRRHLRQWLDVVGWPSPGREDILLAACEAVANAVEHAGGGRAAGVGGPGEQQTVRVTATVELQLGARRVRVSVGDRGRWCEPDERDDGASRPRRGLSLMSEVMAEVSVLRGENGTEVTMVGPWLADSLFAAGPDPARPSSTGNGRPGEARPGRGHFDLS